MGSIYKRKYRTKDGEVKESPTLWIKYFRDGKPYRESAGTEKEGEAKHLLKLREGDVARGVAITPKVGRVRLGELFDDVLTDYRVNGKRSIRDIESKLRLHLRPYFGERRASAVTTADVNKYIEIRQGQGVTNATVNRETATLKRAYNLAIQAGKVMHRPHVPMLKESAPRAGFHDRERFESLRRHLSPTLQRVAMFAYVTGWRVPSEVLRLQWRQVDLKAGTVVLDAGTTKNGDARIFYLTEELKTVLAEQKAVTDETQRKLGAIIAHVWHRANGKRISGFRKAWSTACHKAGVPGAIIHDFRRSAVRNLVRAGVPERVAMTMTGHKTRSVFERYNIVSPGDLQDAAKRLDTFAGTTAGTTDQSSVRSSL